MPAHDAADSSVICIDESVKAAPLLGLTASSERAYDGADARVVRGGIALPPPERVFLTITLPKSLSILSVALIFTLVLALALAVFGCGTPDAETLSASGAATTAETDVLDASLGAPLRVALVQDMTGSSEENMTPLLSHDQLRSLIALCRTDGGELTVGVIKENSNHVFARLTIERPPAPPVKAVPTGGNAIALQAARQKAEKAYAAEKAGFTLRVAAWEDIIDRREADFLARVQQLLARLPDARRSDVHDAVRRADRFLAEDDAIFGAPSHRYLVAVSDCIDNVRKPAPQLTSGATFIVVNGAGSLGTLGELHPHQFESIDAAVRFIAAKEGKTSLASREEMRRTNATP